MKIGIDISQIVYGTGVSTYTENLVRHLTKSGDDYILFAGTLRRRGDVQQFYRTLNGNVKLKLTPLSPTIADILWNRLHTFPVERLIGKVDVFHSSDWAQPPVLGHSVTTVHDLAPLKFPDLTDPKVVAAHQRRISIVVRKSERIIVPSKATADDLISLSVKPDRVRVIPEGVEPKYKNMPEEATARAKSLYGIKGDYIIAVGNNPRKNTERIVKAHKILVKTMKTNLVIVGHGRTGTGAVYTGYIPDADYIALLSGAQCLVYPSLYEGFGLPVLQAMACGTPVVTSDMSSMPEVAGDAAVLVNPKKVPEIADGIRFAIENSISLQKAGIDRATLFTWEKTASDTYAVYKELARR